MADDPAIIEFQCVADQIIGLKQAGQTPPREMMVSLGNSLLRLQGPQQAAKYKGHIFFLVQTPTGRPAPLMLAQVFAYSDVVCEIGASVDDQGRPCNVFVSSATGYDKPFVLRTLEIAYLDRRVKDRAANAGDPLNEIERRTRDGLEDVYSGRMKLNFSHTEASHQTTDLQVGYRTAPIDIEIAPLVEALWRLGMDTISTCQAEPWGTRHWAYVEFARDFHAQLFRHVLEKEGLETKYELRAWMKKQKSDEGGLSSGRVLFDPCHIPKLTELFSTFLVEHKTNVQRTDSACTTSIAECSVPPPASSSS